MMRSLGLFLAAALLAGLASVNSTTGASAQGAPLFAVLLGGNECDTATPPNCRQGDLNGYGGATIILVAGETPQICFGIVTDNIGTINGAHIHKGMAGQNNPPLVSLPPAAGAGDPDGWGGCTSTGVTAALLTQIRNFPSNFYVNVHTNDFTAGAIRGQLF